MTSSDFYFLFFFCLRIQRFQNGRGDGIPLFLFKHMCLFTVQLILDLNTRFKKKIYRILVIQTTHICGESNV